MNHDVIYLTDLILEYFHNINPAGEYSGDWPVLKNNIEFDVFVPLASKIQQQEEMREWNL